MTTAPSCRACHVPLVTEARYCHRCGRAVTAGGAAERAPWILAWSLVAMSVGVITWFVVARNPEPAPGPAPPAQAAGGAPPDISQMSPRERFLRLHDRIMSAAEQGDTATVTRFAPMALTAYGMLDAYDPDVRFHAGLIHLKLGQAREALALADTIQVEAPHHLLAEILRAEALDQRGDTKGAARSRRAFLDNFDQQVATGRPEYEEHRNVLDDFRAQTTPR